VAHEHVDRAVQIPPLRLLGERALALLSQQENTQLARAAIEERASVRECPDERADERRLASQAGIAIQTSAIEP
jgi:hypothetical protein